MTTCLVLRLAGPMQSWGTRSRFSDRDTEREPSKSGVVGLLCAALGFDRDHERHPKTGLTLADLANMPMGVRVDREGIVATDYHTAGGGTFNGRPYGVIKADGSKPQPVVSHRRYLADAEFHVALQGERTMLEILERALADPVWPLWLGRKSFIPTPPLCLGIHGGTIEEVLKRLPWRRRPYERIPQRLRMVLECAPGEGAARMDVPACFANGQRRFHVRFVRTDCYCEGFPIRDETKEQDPCISPD